MIGSQTLPPYTHTSLFRQKGAPACKSPCHWLITKHSKRRIVDYRQNTCTSRVGFMNGAMNAERCFSIDRPTLLIMLIYGIQASKFHRLKEGEKKMLTERFYGNLNNGENIICSNENSHSNFFIQTLMILQTFRHRPIIISILVFLFSHL